MIERVTRAVLDIFCSYYAVISAISYVQLLYHVYMRFVNQRLTRVNNSLYIASLASLVSNVKYNMAKTNHIDSTRPAPISTNESTTVY